MSATFGVLGTYQNAPTGGYIYEATTDDSAEVVTVRDEQGITRHLGAKKFRTLTTTISGRGKPDFGTLFTGSNTAPATAQVTSIKMTESNEDFPTFEIEMVSYPTVSAS